MIADKGLTLYAITLGTCASASSNVTVPEAASATWLKKDFNANSKDQQMLSRFEYPHNNVAIQNAKFHQTYETHLFTMFRARNLF